MTDFLAGAARVRPDAPALDDGARGWSYRELDRRATAAAERLRAAGVTGRAVALVSETTGSAALAVHAVLRAGGVLAPLSPRLTPEELQSALETLRPHLLLVARESRERVLGAGVRAVPLDALEGEGSGAIAREPSDQEDPAHQRALDPVALAHGVRAALPEGTRAVLWSSGTGGRARGVALTAANLEASVHAASERLGLRATDRWLASLGLAHVGGLMLVLRAAANGASLVTRGRFDPDEAAELVEAGAVTHASLVPTMLRQLLDVIGDRHAPAFRCALVGGAACPPALLGGAQVAGVPVALTYGMTETTSQAATADPGLVRRKPGTVGAPVARLELRVGLGGEILLRGPTVAAGYVGSELPLLDADGWLSTGDLGEIDGEGHLWITGRLSDRIVTGGVNVDPVEVEEVLRQHANVVEAVVVGVPDERWGEVVAAAVVCSSGAHPEPSELAELARARLSAAKVPRRWIFFAELPRSVNGKVDRKAVRRGFPST